MTSDSANSVRHQSRRTLVLLTIVVAIVLALVGVELSAQLYTVFLRRDWTAVRARPNHLFRAAANPVFSFELKPDYVYDDGRRRVVINGQGIRDTGAVPAAGRWKAAFVGDSVTFGQGLDQSALFTERLQAELVTRGASVKILNFGVPGYDVADLAESLVLKDAHYRADALYYLLNLNDFARKDTRFEGADNGLYRMYRLPLLKSPMFIRKAIFRWHKQGTMATPGWYRWMVNGNFHWAEQHIQRMADYARDKHTRFTILVLPAGCAYGNGRYDLQNVHDRIAAGLRTRGIHVIDLSASFAERYAEWFDKTDHLTAAGHRKLAQTLGPVILADFGGARTAAPPTRVADAR